MVEVFKALAEETRLRIIAQIMKGDMCVCEIEECLKLTQSNASRHLNALRRAGILTCYKNAQWSYYKLSDEFCKNHHDLYLYLQDKITKIPQYQEDNKNYEWCKTHDICSNRKLVEH